MVHSGPLFLYVRLFNTVNVHFKCLPMTGFKLLTPGIGSDHSTNWATTTALVIKFNTPSISSTHWCLQECNQTKTIWLKRNKFTTFGWVDVGGGTMVQWAHLCLPNLRSQVWVSSTPSILCFLLTFGHAIGDFVLGGFIKSDEINEIGTSDVELWILGKLSMSLNWR